MKHGTMLLWTLLALVGCASLTSANEERLELYQTHSTPVESLRITRLQGRQTRWSPIGDQALLVYDESDQPHLLELQEKCSGLATARSISITNDSGTVTPDPTPYSCWARVKRAPLTTAGSAPRAASTWMRSRKPGRRCARPVQSSAIERLRRRQDELTSGATGADGSPGLPQAELIIRVADSSCAAFDS